jgi:hypothetical protein
MVLLRSIMEQMYQKYSLERKRRYSRRMDAAPLDRPTPATVLRSYATTLGAEPEQVFAALVAHLDGATVDADSLRAVVQGGWWYRAEYVVLADDDGARIEHELVNVAKPLHWAGPITGRAAIADSAGAFQRLVSAVVDDLSE